MKQSEVAKVLTMLVGAYPTANVTEETIVVYEQMLRDLPTNLVVQVVLEHIASSKWFPAIAEIRDRVFEIELELPSADAVLRDLASGGVVAGHSVVKEALQTCGGAWNYRNSTKPEMWRAEFRKVYKSLCEEAKQRQSRARMEQLCGAARRQLDA